MGFAGVKVCSGPASEQIAHFINTWQWQLGVLSPDASLVLKGGDTWAANMLDYRLSFLKTSGTLDLNVWRTEGQCFETRLVSLFLCCFLRHETFIPHCLSLPRHII